jgi:hypothetical protein
MNGFIKRTMTVLCLGGVTALGGCCWTDKHLCDCYDNCWPDRYCFQAQQSVMQAFGAQVYNGHVLEQTMFTFHFVPGKAELTAGGMERLSYLARHRPEPDTHLYLQTAQDVVYNPKNPEKYAADRSKLDAERIEAIQRYLSAETAGRPVMFEVAIHDAPTPGLAAPPMGVSILKHYGNFQGVLPSGSVGGAGTGASTPR